MVVTQDERETIDRQAVRIAYLERQAAHALAVERDSRALLQAAHAELIQVRANTAHLHSEIERRDARIQELKAQLERIRNSVPARIWQAAARRLGR